MRWKRCSSAVASTALASILASCADGPEERFELEVSTSQWVSDEDESQLANNPEQATSSLLVYENDLDRLITHGSDGQEKAGREDVQGYPDLDEGRLPRAICDDQMSAHWFVRGSGVTVQNAGEDTVHVSVHFEGEHACAYGIGRQEVGPGQSRAMRPEKRGECVWESAKITIYDEFGLEHRVLKVEAQAVER